MGSHRSIVDVLRKSLKDSDLPFRDFVELVLYHPRFGYYAQAESPVGREGDYVTSPVLSPVFSYSLGNLCREFMSRSGDGVWQVVDIGCGDGGLIRALATDDGAHFYGVDRNLGRVVPAPRVTYVTSLDEIPPADARLII